MARKISVEIVGTSDSLTRAFHRSSSAARSWNRDIRQSSRGAIAATVGFSGLGRALALGSSGFLIGGALTAGLKKSIEGFTSFQDTMQKTVGLASVAQKQVGGLSKAILSLAPAVGKSPQELAQAFYFIASSGIAANKSIAVLKASAQGAVAGLGDTAQVADAVTSVLNAYGQANITAAKATDVLVATVREGKGEASQFAPVIGNVVALAAQLGVSFDQVGAALAAQTRLGTDAETTAIQLQRIFSALLKVTPKSAEAFASVGLNADKLRQDLGDKGLLNVLLQVKKAFGNNIPALSKAFGDVRGFRGILNLVGKQAGETQKVFDRLAHSAGATKKAFDAVDKDTAQAFRKLRASAEVAGISLGAIFAPVAVQIARGLTVATQAFTKFTDRIGAAKGFSAKIKVVTDGVNGLGARLSRDIVREFKQIDFAQAGREVSNKLSDALDAITEDLSKVKWDAVGKAIVQGVVSFLAHINWPKLFLKTVKAMRAATRAVALLLVGAGQELMSELLKGIQLGAKIALLYVEKFALELVKKVTGATSFLGHFDPFAGVKEKATRKLKEIQAAIDALHGKTVEINIETKVTANEHGRGAGPSGKSVKDQIKRAGNASSDISSQAALEAAKAAAATRAAAAKAAKAKKQAQDAFAKVIDAFNLAQEKAEATKSLRDDLAVQKGLQAAIRAEIKIEGKTTDLERQLFESIQKTKEIRQQIAQAQVDLHKKKQFGALGLTPEGDRPVASATTLLKRTSNLRNLIKGTALDTTKTATELNRITKVLQGKFGKVGRDVRSAIVDMLNDIQDALGGGGSKRGPLTKTHGLNTKKIVDGLGLDEDQIRELRSRLSGFNTGGRALGGSAEAATKSATRTSPNRVGGRGGDGAIIVESHVTVKLDGDVVGKAVTRSQQKTNRRNPRQKRGPHR